MDELRRQIVLNFPTGVCLTTVTDCFSIGGFEPGQLRPVIGTFFLTRDRGLNEGAR